MERISPFRPKISEEIKKQLKGLLDSLLTCPSPSRDSIEKQLRNNPVHECGLSFYNASEYLKKSENTASSAIKLFNTVFERKMNVFMNPTIRQRLEKGKSEPQIARLFDCKNMSELRAYLVETCLSDPSFIEIIDRYLKRIVIKRVHLSDFKPSINTVEKGQIPLLVEEFQKFMENELNSIEKDEDSLPMLQVD